MEETNTLRVSKSLQSFNSITMKNEHKETEPTNFEIFKSFLKNYFTDKIQLKKSPSGEFTQNC